MTDILQIKNGSFEAEIILDGLPKLPLVNIKKLFKLMFNAPRENREALEIVANWLPDVIKDAGAEWKNTCAILDRKRVAHVCDRSSSAKAKRAKNAYERLMKIQNIFNALKEKES